MKSSSASPIATAVPLKTTARPAVAIVRIDRLLARRLRAVLLAVAVDHEQRVVDRDPEPDQHHHVLRCTSRAPCCSRRSRRSRASPGSTTAANRNGSRNESVPKTKTRSSERDRDRDEQLADLEVAREDRVEVVLDRRLAGDVEPRARESSRPRGACSSVWPFASAGSSDETIVAVATCGETARAPTKRPVGSALRRPHAPRRAARARSRRRSPSVPRDERERARRLLAEVVVEDRLRAPRVRARQREPVREQVRQPGRGPAADDEERDPHGEHRLPVAEHPARPALDHRLAACSPCAASPSGASAHGGGTRRRASRASAATASLSRRRIARHA